MVTRDTVERWLREAFLDPYVWLAQYITDITNLMAPHALEARGIPTAVQGAIREIKASARRPGAEGVKKILVEHLQSSALVFESPEGMDALRPPQPPPGWNPHEIPAAERELQEARLRQHIQALRRCRSRSTGERGQLLVRAALTLLGKYTWVPSGLDPERSYFPSTQTIDKATDQPTSNDFAIWINHHTPLTDAARLNCWEAVFVCAVTAGLLSESQLRMNYVASAVVAVRSTLARTDSQRAREGGVGSDFLLRVFMNFDKSVPIVPGTELMPSPGDLIFIGGDHHVVICCGVEAHRGFDGIEVISHWRHPSHGIQRLPLDTWGEGLLAGVRFVPCPF